MKTDRRLSQNCRLYKHKSHYVQNYAPPPHKYRRRIRIYKEITWRWKIMPRSFPINNTWYYLMNHKSFIMNMRNLESVYLQFCMPLSIKAVGDMWIIYVIMVSETRHNGELVEVQSWSISPNHTPPEHTLDHINTKRRVGFTLQLAPEKGTIRTLLEAWLVFKHSNKE